MKDRLNLVAGLSIEMLLSDSREMDGTEIEGIVTDPPPRLTLAAIDAGLLGMTSVVMGMLSDEMPAF